MGCWFLRLIVLLCCACFSYGLYDDEAGKLDFLIASAGHGAVNFVFPVDEESFITSDADETIPGESCYVASRRIVNGDLLWRRNACSSKGKGIKGNAITASQDKFYTFDSEGTLRGWKSSSGSLLWDTMLEPVTNPIIWVAHSNSVAYVVAGGKGGAVFAFHAETGEMTTNISRSEIESARPRNKEKKESVYCDILGFEIYVSDANKGIVTLKGKDQVAHDYDIEISDRDFIKGIHLLSCGSDFMETLVTTKRGTTLKLTASSNKSIDTVWRKEEGLSGISSARIVDSSHFAATLDESGAGKLLSIPARLNSQLSRFRNAFSFALNEESSRDHAFGFQKVAVLMSGSFNRIYGIDTTGENRAKTRYTIDLPEHAVWHKIVYGYPNTLEVDIKHASPSHSRDILVISSFGDNKVAWVCFDGKDGIEHSEGEVNLSSQLIQIVPLAAEGKCRQNALLVMDDGSIHLVQNDNKNIKGSVKQIQSSANGFFVQKMQKQDATIETFRLTASNDAILGLQSVGKTHFPGEEIIRAAYVNRDEVVQSPCSVMGDESLLLKYLNPHLSVVMTRRVEEKVAVLSSKSNRDVPMSKKPIGASSKGEKVDPREKETIDVPNFFVNLVDTVSGRVIYRTGHSDVSFSPLPTAVISENWVFYSFNNEKTKRGEIGVLSLYEGIIDSTGMTLFNSPEQITSFTSLDARDLKPVVLAKTYTTVSPVTAMGVTSTRNGISGRRLLLASVDGQISSVDRKMVETRRPMGPVKESEKLEGLQQYSELIPKVPYLSLSYFQTVEYPTSIMSAPVDLESQTLILAYGGPDIFFIRSSPSGGFDLLPDSFNRPMLSLVVVLLVLTLFIIKVSGCVGTILVSILVSSSKIILKSSQWVPRRFENKVGYSMGNQRSLNTSTRQFTIHENCEEVPQ